MFQKSWLCSGRCEYQNEMNRKTPCKTEHCSQLQNISQSRQMEWFVIAYLSSCSVLFAESIFENKTETYIYKTSAITFAHWIHADSSIVFSVAVKSHKISKCIYIHSISSNAANHNKWDIPFFVHICTVKWRSFKVAIRL